MASELGLGGSGVGFDRYGAFLRDLRDRVRGLESRRNMATGDWVLRQEPGTGALVAENLATGVVVVVAVP